MTTYRDIESLTAPLYIGNGADRTAFSTAGRPSFEAEARATRELPFSFLGARLDLPAGGAYYDYDENCVVFDPSGDIGVQADRIIGNILYQHDVDASEGTTPIIRFKQTSTDNTEFSMQFRVQSGSGGAPAVAWSSVITADVTSNGVFPFTGTPIIQFLRFATISGFGEPGAIIQGRIARTDANVGSISSCFVGLEYKVNRLGD